MSDLFGNHIVGFPTRLKPLLCEGLSEPDIYGDLVYKGSRKISLVRFPKKSSKSQVPGT